MSKLYRLFLATTSLVGSILSGGVAALSQTADNYLADLDSVRVVIFDHVSDGCWPRPRSTEEQVRLEILRSNLDISDSASSKVQIHFQGGILKDGQGREMYCFFTYEIDLFDCGEFELSFSSGRIVPGCRVLIGVGGYAFASKESSQSKISELTLDGVRTFLLQIEEDRRANGTQ